MNGTFYDFSTTGLEVVGKGSRRVCYRIPETDLCAKFYRTREDLSRRSFFGLDVGMQVARFCRWTNVNYQEWRYLQTLRQRLPAELLAVFPERLEPAYSAQKGWGLVESLILNADGTSARPLMVEMASVSDPDLRLRLFTGAALLFEELARHSVCFFDPPNVLVQWAGPDTFRLRIADFEPQCRALIPGLSSIKPYVRSKVRRRGRRFLVEVRARYLPDSGQGEAAVFSRPPEKRWRPAAASF
jgi:hypothetical protein